MGTVEAIFRYPVKSMAGESLDHVHLGAGGMPGDRAWAVRDEVRGGIRGGKKLPKLMTFRAWYQEPPAEVGSSPASIELPDGAHVTTSDADVASRISKGLDHEVSLWPLLPAAARDHYLRGAPEHADLEQELRAMFGRKPDEPLPDLGKFPPEIMEFESPPGTYFDAYPLLILSRQSLETMAQAAPDSRFDVRRFRPNLLVDLPIAEEPFPEASLEGRRLRVGGALVVATIACPRCVMTTHGFEDLPKDPGIMRALVSQAGGNLGLYARVVEPGAIAQGDTIEPVDP